MREATHNVFVYGMLLPDAHEPATLHGWRLAFNGHATIEPAEGERVLGGIIRCDDDYLRHLDQIEGEGSYYDRVRVPVSTGLAWVYIMRAEARFARPVPPGSHYIDLIERGYLRFEYPINGLLEAVERAEAGVTA